MKICLGNEVDVEAENLRGWLLLQKTYVVLSVEQYPGGEIGFRVASEQGRKPMLFRASLFDVIDRSLPKSWRVSSIQANMLELGPKEFEEDGFLEKCYDHDPVALEEYRRVVEKIISES